MNSSRKRQSILERTIGLLALSTLLVCAGLLLGTLAPAQAREQWQIQRPDPAPTGPYTAGRFGGGNAGGDASNSPYSNNPAGSTNTPYSPFNVTATPALPSAGAPQSAPNAMTPDFFKQFMANRLNPGTILTGVIDNDLHSGNSQKGETFAIVLEDGYAREGKEMIPRGSRIIGSVNSTMSAMYKKHGMPGSITISLQTLVFPDGRTTNFNGFIDHNPNHLQDEEPKTKFAGFNFSDYGQSVKGMLYSSVAGIGGVHKKMIRGKEFQLKKGTSVAVKVNRTVDLSAMKASASGIPGLPLGQPAVPGLVGGTGGFDGGGMPLIPGLTTGQATAGGAVPGLVGAPATPVVPGVTSPSFGTPGLAGTPGVVNQPFGAGIPGLPGTQISPAAQFAGNQRYSVLPGHLAGDSPNAVPGMVSNPVIPTNNQAFNSSAGLVPGSGELPPLAPSFQGNGTGSVGGNFGTGTDDPNSIFKNPINAPSFSMPDPF